MNAYITYDRYEHDEDHSLYYIGTNRKEAMARFKEVDLPDFLSMGPDDCHTFLLQKVNMTRAEYNHLIKLKTRTESDYDPDAELEIGDFLTKCYGDHSGIIYDTDGDSDMMEIFALFIATEHPGLDEESDEYSELWQTFFEDEGLFNRYMRIYIEETY